MRYSKLLGKTLREKPRSVEAKSYELLVRSGFVRPLATTNLGFLPLGFRVLEKLDRVIADESISQGVQRILVTFSQPSRLLKERHTHTELKPKLTACRKQSGLNYFLAEYHEETLSALAGILGFSYRELPIIVSHSQWKYREEARLTSGLLRSRHLLMHSAYSLDQDDQGLAASCAILNELCQAVFDRTGLQTVTVKKMNFGSFSSEDYLVLSDKGGEVIFACDACEYKATRELAESVFPELEQDPDLKPLREVQGPGLIDVSELAQFVDIPVQKTTKTLLFESNRRVVVVCIRGDYDVSEAKLANVLECADLRLASADLVKELTGIDLGYAGPIGLSNTLEVIWDLTTERRINFEVGANRRDYHCINVNFDRDIPRPPRFVDVRQIKEGEVCRRCHKGELQRQRTVKVGHVSSLGTLYSKELEAMFVDRSGKSRPIQIGCCGLEVTRLLAAVIEQNHDERGIIWPKAIAPFTVHLISLPGAEDSAAEIYARLKQAQVEVLWDDREETPGVKFSDADLIGIPIRLVTSKRVGQQVEWKKRDEVEIELLTLEEVIRRLTAPEHVA